MHTQYLIQWALPVFQDQSQPNSGRVRTVSVIRNVHAMPYAGNYYGAPGRLINEPSPAFTERAQATMAR